jgi:pSer/pThr/pTyr-binding forkhead associated (FHA) protein
VGIVSLVCVDVASVSRHHARILVEGDRATLEDLRSKNGTYRRNRRLKAPEALQDGDEIRVGTVPMVFRRFTDRILSQSCPPPRRATRFA